MPLLILAGYAVSSLGNLLTGVSFAILAALGFQVVRGLGIAAMDVGHNTLIQRLVPADMLGRVFGNVYGAVGAAAACHTSSAACCWTPPARGSPSSWPGPAAWQLPAPPPSCCHGPSGANTPAGWPRLPAFADAARHPDGHHFLAFDLDVRADDRGIARARSAWRPVQHAVGPRLARVRAAATAWHTFHAVGDRKMGQIRVRNAPNA